MEEIQRKVDDMICQLGGYWRPLSGLARLMEEIGEVAEVFASERYESLEEELTDVLVISVCLANQFAVRLEDSKTFEVEVTFYDIVRQAGEVARILNAYDGDKALKHREKPITFAQQIQLLVTMVLQFSRQYGIDVKQHIRDVIATKTKRDLGRFQLTPDPITEASVRNFQPFLEGRYWGGVPLRANESAETYVKREHHLKRYLKIAEVEGLEGFVIEFPMFPHQPAWEEVIQDIVPEKRLQFHWMSDRGGFLVISLA